MQFEVENAVTSNSTLRRTYITSSYFVKFMNICRKDPISSRQRNFCALLCEVVYTCLLCTKSWFTLSEDVLPRTC